MTRNKTPDTCDFCATDITSEKQYSMQITVKTTTRTKGRFIKLSKNADCCHKCYLAMRSNGYDGQEVIMQQNPDTKKWNELDTQKVLSTNPELTA